jgi:hypothetical protein
VAWYLTIRSDGRYSQSTAFEPLVEHLLTFPELRRTGRTDFQNVEGEPQVHFIFAMADEKGNYANHGELPVSINVVELVCWGGDEAWYESLAYRIASHLDWEAVEEHGGRVKRVIRQRV